MSGSSARVMYSAEFTGGLSRGVCSPDYHYTPQIICYIVVLKVLKSGVYFKIFRMFKLISIEEWPAINIILDGSRVISN